MAAVASFIEPTLGPTSETLKRPFGLLVVV
jgi:hypothetical protein